MTLLSSPLALHDVQNVEGFAVRIVSEHRAARQAHLSREQVEDMTSFLIETAYRLSLKYDPERSAQSFSTYAGRLLRLRITDWYRSEFPGTRGGLRPITEELTSEERGSLDYPPEVVSMLEAVNVEALTPAGQRTFRRVLVPMVEEGKTAAALADERGHSRRWVAKALKSLRSELEDKCLIAA